MRASISDRAGDVRLARHYRRLLVCYPGRFRREHGDELVGTLLEMAEPGQTRPTMRDAWHLVAGGLRMRLRLPANRPLARVSAVLITMIGAALGGAAASWAAVEIGAPLPSNAKVSALATQVAPGGLDVGWFRSSMAWWMFEPAPRATELVDVPVWAPNPGRDRLAAEGWRVSAISDGRNFDAARNGLHMWVSGWTNPQGVTVQVTVEAGNTPARVSAVIAGVLLGAFLGWLLTAAAAYRMRLLPVVRRRIAATLAGLGMTALALPAAAVSLTVARILHLPENIVERLHEAVNVSQYGSLVTSSMLVQLSVAGLLLTAAAWAALAHRSASDAAQDDMPAVG